jgi:hypothetical protein
LLNICPSGKDTNWQNTHTPILPQTHFTVGFSFIISSEINQREEEWRLFSKNLLKCSDTFSLMEHIATIKAMNLISFLSARI